MTLGRLKAKKTNQGELRRHFLGIELDQQTMPSRVADLRPGPHSGLRRAKPALVVSQFESAGYSGSEQGRHETRASGKLITFHKCEHLRFI